MLAPRDGVTGVLLGAADYIERHGWCQGTSRIDDAVCTAWALSIAAAHDFVTAEQAGYRLMHSVRGPMGYSGGNWGIAVWNDTAGRTKEEVVEALRSAAFAPAGHFT
jgi:hypothetical protein